MQISYDPAKREQTLRTRELDFDDAPLIFDGLVYTFEDDRRDYGEIRSVTIGRLRGRMAVLVWTQRGETLHIISLRKANNREEKKYQDRMG